MSNLKRKADSTATANDSKKPKKDASLTSFFGAPKTTTTSSSGDVMKFDKGKWVATLNKEQKELLQLEIDTLDPTWLSHLKDEITKPGFLELKKFLNREIAAGKTVFPPLEDIYSWSRHTPLNTVKVVMLGQDPYHNDNQAHGLCFSVRPPTPAPSSLQNMYKELKNNYPSFKAPPNRSGLLTPWAEQGILMLNACLTVRAHEPNSHSKKGWEAFTQKVIDTVVKVRTRGVIFLAWGNYAQQRCAKITGGKHFVLKSVHPSGLSAAKGFFGCEHFKKTNNWLEERYGKDEIINWDLNVPTHVRKPGESNQPLKDKTDQKMSTATKETLNNKSEKAADDVDEFGDEDEDAIEAMNELAKSDAVEPPSSAKEADANKSESKGDENKENKDEK